MDKKYKEYQKQIKKEHRFGFWNNPGYEEFIELPIKKLLFLPLAEKVIGLLSWEVVLQENDKIYARSKEKWGVQGKITITYLEYSKIKIFSESVLDERWDNGKNSLRVKLFIQVFQEELKKLSKEEKERIEKDFEGQWNWNDYEVPETLSLPKTKKVIPLIPIVGSLVAIISIGIFAGFVDLKIIEGNSKFRLFNIPFIFEALVAFVFFFIQTRLSRWGNFTELKALQRLSITSLLLYFLSKDFTFYILSKFPWVGPIDFLNFIINYYEPFFTKQDLFPLIYNSLSILFFIFTIGFIFWIRLIAYISFLKYKRVPTEVFEFVEYLFLKNKSEVEIRHELSKKGWKSEQAQNEVFEAFEGFVQGVELLKT